MNVFETTKRRRPRQPGNNLWVLLASFLMVITLGVVIFAVGMTFGREKPKENDTASPVSVVSTQIEEIPAKVTSKVVEESAAKESVTSSEPRESLPDESAEAASEPLVIVRPELEQIKEFVPTGGTFTRYWWNNMNEDAFDEVLVGYTKDGETHILNLGVHDETVGYEVTWDHTLPAGTLVDLSSQRAGEGYLVKAETTDPAGGKVNLYQFGEDEIVTYPIVGGRLDGERTEVAYFSTDDSGQRVPARASYGERILFVDYVADSQPADALGGVVVYDRETYEFQDGEFIFLSMQPYAPVTEEGNNE